MIRPFRVRGESDLDPLADRLSSLAEAWARDWLGAGPWPWVSEVGGEPGEHEKQKWAEAWRAPEAPERWCAARLESERQLTCALFGSELGAVTSRAPSFELAAEVTRRAVADLAIRILAPSSPPAHPEPLPDGAGAVGSGACVVGIDVRGAAIRCLLSPAAADFYLGHEERGLEERAPALPPGSLTPRAQALSGVRVRARAVVGKAELPLRALAALRVGDVISLDQRVDEPSLLVFPELAVDCSAYLCEQDGHNALLLEVPESSGAGEPPREAPTD